MKRACQPLRHKSVLIHYLYSNPIITKIIIPEAKRSMEKYIVFINGCKIVAIFYLQKNGSCQPLDIRIVYFI